MSYGGNTSRPPALDGYFKCFLRLKSYRYFNQFVKQESFHFVIEAEAPACGRSPRTA
jgi:hypothetical protein